MKYKTAFRLALKAFGVLLIFEQLPQLVSAATGIGIELSANRPANDIYAFSLSRMAGAIAGIVFGLYLFTGANWIVNKAIPSNRPYCPECGYELTGRTGDIRCPECGMRSDGVPSHRIEDIK